MDLVAVANITVTVTSYYTPAPTTTSTDIPHPSQRTKNFAAIAAGASVGGFLFTCLLGAGLLYLWKKRHPERFRNAFSAPVRVIRSDAENFPGWRRVRASRLVQATHGRDSMAATDDLTVEPKPEDTKVQGPILRGAIPEEEYSTANGLDAGGGHGAGDASSSRSPSSPRPSSIPSFLLEYKEMIATNAMDEDSPAASPILSTSHGLPPHLVAEPSSPIDLASQSSHHSTRAPPSPTMSRHRHRTPSPTHHRNPSHNVQHQRIPSQGSIPPTLVAGPSSWHGHSSSLRPGHASWSGTPLVGYAQPQYMQYSSPPTSWSGHQSSGSWGSQRPLLPTNSNNPSGSSSIPNPPQPVHHAKFYFHRSTGDVAGPPIDRSGTWSPPPPRPPRWSPPRPVTPPSPPLEPPRRLTVTNPDLTNSPNASDTSLPRTPQKEQPP